MEGNWWKTPKYNKSLQKSDFGYIYIKGINECVLVYAKKIFCNVQFNSIFSNKKIKKESNFKIKIDQKLSKIDISRCD